MSVLNQSGEEQVECPLCMEPLEVDDLHFYPCTCGYQICRFCWNRIREGENGLCPACRKAYPENPADFTPLSQEQVAAIKTEKKAREQKRRNKTLESRRALANVRVVQNNLVFVVGLPVRLADPEILKRQEYFGKYGKIHKVVINQSTAYAGSQGPSASAYVTYVSPADALRAIQGVNNVALDGRVLKGSLGTTKYCANFMKNQPCPKPDCMYLHELGDPKASFTKEEMHAGLHQVYERKLHQQLLQAQRDAKDDKHYSTSGNSSTNAEKGSSKDGNQTNFIPTTVVTSSHINVVNSSKSNKKESSSNSSSNGSSSGGGSGSSSGASSSTGKEAWPSLGSSPPCDSPARKQPSPKPHHSTVKSQENGTSESSSPTLVQQQSQTKSKEHTDTKTRSNKDSNSNGTNGQTKKKDKKHKNTEEDTEKHYTQPQQSVFESETQNFLSNELDELESDRHSLLENHDLLDSSDHSLLEDDNTHSLLNDANNEVMMMQRHREMLAGLVETNHILPHLKSPLVNGYGLLDRDTMSYIGNDRQISQLSQGLAEQQKELALRERERRDLLMRADLRHEHKPFLPLPSIPRDNNTEILGANYHQNPNMLPPFGMRVDNSMGTSSMPAGAGAGGFLLHGQLLGQPAPPVANGFDAQQSASSGRYLAENMDKFFTDFHKAQQLRLLTRGEEHPAHSHSPRVMHMLSAERLELQHQQRMNNINRAEGLGAATAAAAGDGDDDLDFDPFKETQKALAEMMETEMMQNTISSGDNMERVRRARLPPPGFSHASAFPRPRAQPLPHQHQHQHQPAQDWTQMDPAIMSTSVNFGKAPPPLSQQQQELFARFNQLGVTPNGVNKMQVPLVHGWPHQQQKLWPSGAMGSASGTGMGAGAFGLGMGGMGGMGGMAGMGMGGMAGMAGIPLPPGFAPAKAAPLPAECIDAK